MAISMAAGLVVERQRAALDRLGPLQQMGERRLVERLEHQHAGAREQRRVQLEGRVLGGRADQRDGAVLHHRQEGILLGPVEAVDLVDEEQRALPRLAPAARLLEHLLEVGDAGEDGRDLLEAEVGLARQQPRNRGLAGARRPPEDERAERAGVEHPGERAVRPQQVVLADDVGERLRPQPVGQRPRRRLFEPCCLKQRRHGISLAAELEVKLLAAAIDDEVPETRVLAGDAGKLPGRV